MRKIQPLDDLEGQRDPFEPPWAAVNAKAGKRALRRTVRSYGLRGLRSRGSRAPDRERVP